jgi:uncharacterized phage infection (PIP) family protein YhgE
MRTMTITRTATLLAAAGIALAGLAACSGEERSEENFCSTVNDHRDQFTAAMDTVTSSADIGDGLNQAGDAFNNLGDMWSELADVAPEDIQDDAETMDKAFGSDSDETEETEETEGSGGPLAGLSDALGTAQSAVNINNYVNEHCS